MRTHRGAIELLAWTALLVAPGARAQETLAEPRIRKMEAEIRALQRNVFPGGGGKFFTPEIRSTPARAVPSGNPATTPTADLQLRLDSVESSLTRLTARLQQTRERISQLEERVARAQAATATPAHTDFGVQSPLAHAGSAAAARESVATIPPSAQRLAAVRAIVKPSTNDPGDDEYSYGYRLWQAELYPEAQQQLKLFIGKYAHHARISYARNLLGRAFLDDHKPLEAAKWFLENYQSGKSDPRAPDSLLYLSEAMFRLKDLKRACIALDEFDAAYVPGAIARLKELHVGISGKIQCN